MTQYNSFNVKLSNSQLNKLKSAIENGTDVILRLSSNMIDNSDDEANFPQKLLLTKRQVTNIRKAFANHISTDMKLLKAQLTKMQKGGFLRFLAPLLKSGLPLLKSVTIGYVSSNSCCISNRCCNKQKKYLDLEIVLHKNF